MSEDLDETDDYELFIENQAGEQVVIRECVYDC